MYGAPCCVLLLFSMTQSTKRQPPIVLMWHEETSFSQETQQHHKWSTPKLQFPIYCKCKYRFNKRPPAMLGPSSDCTCVHAQIWSGKYFPLISLHFTPALASRQWMLTGKVLSGPIWWQPPAIPASQALCRDIWRGYCRNLSSINRANTPSYKTNQILSNI